MQCCVKTIVLKRFDYRIRTTNESSLKNLAIEIYFINSNYINYNLYKF